MNCAQCLSYAPVSTELPESTNTLVRSHTARELLQVCQAEVSAMVMQIRCELCVGVYELAAATARCAGKTHSTVHLPGRPALYLPTMLSKVAVQSVCGSWPCKLCGSQAPCTLTNAAAVAASWRRRTSPMFDISMILGDHCLMRKILGSGCRALHALAAPRPCLVRWLLRPRLISGTCTGKWGA